MNDLWRNLGYEPHAGQQEFHAADRRFKLLIAGARFGKSMASALEMLPEATAMRARGWIVAPSYALARPEYRYLRDALALGGLILGQAEGGRDGASRLHTRAGGELWALSAGRPEGLLGEELDWLLLCEAAHLDRQVFERYLRPRLGTRLGRLVAATTPRGSNWMHELFLRVAELGDWQRLRFATWDNPRIERQEIDSARQLLPPEVFDEQYGGEFTARAGRVYPEFNPALHVATLAAPPGSVIDRGIDFGFTSPTACLWLARDAQDRLLVLAELYRHGQVIEELAHEIAAMDTALAAPGCVAGRAYCDPAGAIQIASLRRHMLDAVAADNRLGGIDLVRAALRPRADGRPGLMVDRRCVNLLREFEGYRWAQSAGDAQRPEKGNDHCLDALRYAVAGMTATVGWQQGPRLC